VSYEWPEKKNFTSAYACKSLPRTGTDRLYSSLLGPVWNLLPLPDQISATVFSWALLIGLYYLYAEVVPIGPVNSKDGRYVDLSVCAASAFTTYYILSFILILSLYKKGCNLLVEQAQTYLYSAPSFLPATLASSAWPIDETD